MSRYDWPDEGVREQLDDPAGRLAFVARQRRPLDAEGALRASRTFTRPGRRPGVAGPFAPASGRERLWQPLGPGTILGGQAEGAPRVSGRVNAIAVHPLGERVYVASANGGVWYSKNGGAAWVSVAGLATTNTAGILRPAQRNACGAIHVQFGANEGEDVVFLGTGEVMADPGGQPESPEMGVGIFVGTNPTQAAPNADPWVREAPNLVNDAVYQIVSQPSGSGVVAATRTGLRERPAAPAADKNWDRPAGTPFDTLDVACTDVLWTRAHGGAPERLWVWVQTGPSMGLWVRDAGATNFTQVTVDPASGLSFNAARASLAASEPPTQVWVLNDFGNTSPGLFRVTNPAGAPVAHGVVGVPNVLRTQGFYDIAIAVHPTNPNRVALAGSFLGDPYAAGDPDVLLVTTEDGARRGYDASIVVAVVAPDPANANILTYGLPADPFRMLGIGVHPDVHALTYAKGGTQLWTGCDGGVFRSDRPLRPAGFYPVNQGLQISESNFIACHPRCEGYVVAGLQDNGTVHRLSSGVWEEPMQGDGGGVVMNPLDPGTWLAQYVQGTWNHSTGAGHGPVIRGPTNNLVYTGERDAAAFYSSAASIAHKRGSSPSPVTPMGQTLVGTFRPWYTDDFGQTWVTLPTGTDPLPDGSVPGAVGDLSQDDLGAPIRVCKWQSPDVAWVLCEQRIERLARTPNSHDGGGPGTWTAQTLTPPGWTPTGKEKKRPPAPPLLGDAKVWTDLAPDLDPPPAAGQPPVQRGTLGALYIGTTGNVDKPGVDTLWWFDGTDQFHPTGLRAAVPAPVTAVTCDPLSLRQVWVGTTVGVWHGERTDHAGGPPTWLWTQMVNGLPEAAVEDLAIFRDGTLILLRAAIASRGVWEMRLDDTTVQDLTYLRVHDDDLRHRLPTPLVQRNLAAGRSWHGSPDVRPRVAPAAPAPPAAAAPWTRAAPPGDQALRRFQAALRSSTNDPRVVANGIWDAYFSEVLRDHGAPTTNVPAAAPLPALNVVQVDATYFGTHVTGAHATAEPWATPVPTEADLYEHLPRIPEGTAGAASCQLPPGPARVDVVVHRRGLDAIDGANVRVTLLAWMDPASPPTAAPNAPGTWFSGPVPWTAAVNQVLNSGDGKTAQAVGPGWRFVLGATAADSHRVTLTGQTIDPVRAGVATFDLDLTGLAPETVVLLVAVIRAGTTAADDVALAAADLETLARGNANVAVRSLRVAP